MKPKYNMLFAAALMVPMANAADIDLFGPRNNPGAIGTSAATYNNNNYVKASFDDQSSGGQNGGLGTNVYVVHDDANLDGDGDPKTVTWFSTNTYFLRDKLFIPKGTTLTIQPGTKIYASSNNNGTVGVPADDAVGSLTACRGGKLIADGTASAPIIFTTDREWEVANSAVSPISPDAVIGPAPTAADAGLWGGVVLLGQAFVSFVNSSGVNTGTVQIEGFAPAGTASYDGDGIPDATQYGTSAGFPRKDDDNSGILRYVSLRHGGYEFATGKEINGLTMGGVGSGTTIEFVEVYANLDDAFEWFGGRVSCNNLVAAFAQDDSLDMDEGFRGNLQFVLVVQNPGDADGGGELDGVGGSSGGFPTISSGGTLHHAKPIIHNATVLGAGATNTKSQIPTRGATGSAHVNWEKGNVAFIMEDYFNGEFYNSVYTDFAMGVIRYADSPGTSTGNNVVIQNCTFGNFGTWTGAAATSDADYIRGTNAAGYDIIYDGFGDPLNGNTPTGTNLMLTTYTRDSNNFLTALNPIPAPGSPLLTAPISGGAPKRVNYRGAFGPEGNWAAGWTKLSESGVLLGAAPAPAFVDADGDGIDDRLEATQALQDLGFSVGVNNVSGVNGNLFADLYTETSILDLVAPNQVMVQKNGANVTLSLELFRSTTLGSFTEAPALEATFEATEPAEFYRIEVGGAQ